MFCTKCGSRVNNNTGFCGNCGAIVKRPAAANTASMPTARIKPGKAKRLLVISIIAIVAIAALSVAAIATGVLNPAGYQLNLGYKLLNEGNYEEAILAFNKVIEIDEKNVPARLAVYEAYMASEEYDKAEMMLIEAIKPDSENKPKYEKMLSELYKYMAFSDLPESFTFASGAGAWSTEVKINKDGTFTGYYHDSDGGDSGVGYGGTLYESRFNGRFTNIQKISEYEYRMEIDYLHTEGTVGEVKIENNGRYITSDPYGFDDADEFTLYLPGRNTSDLPEQFLGWVRLAWWGSETPPTLPCYGLYNVGGEQGFFGMK